MNKTQGMQINQCRLNDDVCIYYFTKSMNESVSVYYDKSKDYGKQHPSGCEELVITILYCNSWIFTSEHPQINMNDVPSPVRDVLQFFNQK